MNKLSHHPRFKALQYMFFSSLLTFSLNNLMIGWTIATFLILVKVEKNITPLPVSGVNVTGSLTKKCIPHFVVVQFGQLFKREMIN